MIKFTKKEKKKEEMWLNYLNTEIEAANIEIFESQTNGSIALLKPISTS